MPSRETCAWKNTARTIGAGGIVIWGAVVAEAVCRQRNYRSAITCYWGNPRYGAFIAKVIAILEQMSSKQLSPHTGYLSLEQLLPEHLWDEQ